MSDQVIGTCCAVLATLCIDVLTGICIDFMSLRHGCTENLCRCACLRHHASDVSIDDSLEEQDPLLSHTQQPLAHSPMRSTGKATNPA